MKKMAPILTIAIYLGTAGTASAIDASKLYAEKCVPCHGPKGEGTPTGPAQKGNPFITKGKPAEVKKVIMEGRAGKDKKYPNIPVDMPKGLV
ncbi:MAG TPA: c-type cytochrome, partial [Candidatus Manganitrophaceae bacterium]|nr:c-type cytochrome [Candidatus Manganitrophaceae bacterium]